MEDIFVAIDEENALGVTRCWVHNQWNIVINYSDMYVGVGTQQFHKD